MQPVDTKEHDGRTHAAVLEAVNRDGFAEHDPNPVYSAQFQSTSEQRIPDARHVDHDSLAVDATDMPEAEDQRAAETKVSETGRDDSASNYTDESALPTPIRHSMVASSGESAAEIAGERAELFQVVSTPPRNGMYGTRPGDSGSAVLPAASSPLFEPQAALLHTVRSWQSSLLQQPSLLQHTRVFAHRVCGCCHAWLAASDAGSARRSPWNRGSRLHAAATVLPSKAAGLAYTNQRDQAELGGTESFSIDDQVSVRRCAH